MGAYIRVLLPRNRFFRIAAYLFLTSLLVFVLISLPDPPGTSIQESLDMEESWFSRQFDHRQICPDPGPELGGTIEPDLSENITMEEVEHLNRNVAPGGKWQPANCRARHRVAIIVPMRDREVHLRIFLNHMHPFLQDQLLDYVIVVVEQDEFEQFNRGTMLNVGFSRMHKLGYYQCYFFHDIDTLPVVRHNMYSCPTTPQHLATNQETHQYQQLNRYASGALGLSAEHILMVNGFSNSYFGWGREDDDFYFRLNRFHLPISRYMDGVGRYRSIKHHPSKWGQDRHKWFYARDNRMFTDGLNSLRYKLLAEEARPLYTYYKVRVNKTEIRSAFLDTIPEHQDYVPF